MEVKTTGQETLEPNESPSSSTEPKANTAPAAIENSSQGSEEVRKMETQNCIQFMENYKLELTVLTDEVAKMNLEIQELKKMGEKKENKGLLGAQQPMTSNEKTSKKEARTSNDATKCGLCRKLEDFGIQPKDNKHHLTIRGNIEPETCGHLRDLNIQQMADLFKKYEMCRVCAHKPITDVHHEDKCKYTKKVTLAKCQVKDCNLRYFLCTQHEAKNEVQIRNRMEYYKSHNFPFNPKRFNFLKKQQKETRDVSTQTEDNYDSTMADEVEPKTESEMDSISSSTVLEADQETRSDSDPTSETESESEKEDADLPVEKDSARFIPHQVNLDK